MTMKKEGKYGEGEDWGVEIEKPKTKLQMTKEDEMKENKMETEMQEEEDQK
jgi:hypothetical protein